MIEFLRTKALSEVLHTSTVFYYMLGDLHANCFYINPLYLQLIGLPERDVHRSAFSDFLTKDEAIKFHTIRKNCIADPGQPIQTDLKFLLTDGSEITISWEIMALINDANEPDILQCIGTLAKERISTNTPDQKVEIFAEERYKAYELSAEGLWRMDLEVPASIDWTPEKLIEHCRKYLHIAECNDNMARMYGLEKGSELIGARLDQMMNFNDPATLAYMVDFINNGYSIKNSETEEHDVQGNKLFFLNSMTGIIEGRMLKRIWGTQQNITEKKKAEEQLLRSELFYRNLIGDSLDGIILTDPNGVIKFVSPSVERLLGFRPEVIIDSVAFDYIHPDDLELAMATFQEEVQMESVNKFIIVRIKNKFDQWIWCSVRAHNLLYNPYVNRIVIYFQDESDRKISESELKESENRFKTLLNNVSDIIVTSDLNNVITSWNSIAEITTGIKAEDAIGKNYREVIPLDYYPYTREQVAETLYTKGSWKGECLFTNKEGEKRVHLDSFTLIRDEKGNPVSVLVVGKDITDRIQMESKLKESESFYRNLIAHSLDGIVLTDESGIVKYCSPSATRLSGYTVEQLSGSNFIDYVHPEDQPLALKAFAMELSGEALFSHVSLRLKHASGEWIWSTIRGHNQLDTPGFNSIIIYFTDDSRRKSIEVKLIESERRFRHLLNNLRTGVLLMDKEGRVVISNPAAYLLLGISEEELTGKSSFNSHWDIIHENGAYFEPEDRPVFISIQTKQVVRNVVMGVLHPNTRERVWVLVNSEPILDENNEIVHIICSFTDITEQKKLSHQLVEQEIQKQKQLTQATIDGQEKERLEMGKELHDNISQHLTTTRLYLEIIKDKAHENVQEMLHHAHNELTGIIREIRDLSQSLVPPTLGDIGLIASIEDLCLSIQRTHEYVIDFTHTFFLEEMVPEKIRLMLFRIIQEQINNIIRHAGADRITINLESGSDKGVKLQIRDNGRGFDTDAVRKGLGLTNIANRTELFNGKFDIKSTPGKGCVITVIVPLK